MYVKKRQILLEERKQSTQYCLLSNDAITPPPPILNPNKFKRVAIKRLSTNSYLSYLKIFQKWTTYAPKTFLVLFLRKFAIDSPFCHMLVFMNNFHRQLNHQSRNPRLKFKTYFYFGKKSYQSHSYPMLVECSRVIG